MRARLVVLALASLAALAGACRGGAPIPEIACSEQCEKVAGRRCSPKECARGCAFVLDRLVEREGASVLSCIAGGTGPCNDQAFAECAARVPYPDGGPPGLPPVDDSIDEPDDDAGSGKKDKKEKSDLDLE